MEITGDDAEIPGDEGEGYTQEGDILESLEVMTPTELPADAVEAAPLRRSSREHHLPMWMNDYVGSVQTGIVLPHSSSVTPPTFPYIVSSNLSTTYINYLYNITTLHEPSSYTEARQHPEWIKAMQDELDALEQNHT